MSERSSGNKMKRDITLPKIINDGICHAILKDGKTRCPNKTFIKSYKNNTPVYSKWCKIHSTECGQLNKEYKSSCNGVSEWKCSSKGQYIFENGKLINLENCINDRNIFEKKCIHQSKRDLGHQQFVQLLQNKRKKCAEVVKKLQPPKSEVKQIEENQTIKYFDQFISHISIEPSIKKTSTYLPPPSKSVPKQALKKKTKPKPTVITTSKSDDDDLNDLYEKMKKLKVAEPTLPSIPVVSLEKPEADFETKFRQYVLENKINTKQMDKRTLLSLKHTYKEILRIQKEQENIQKSKVRFVEKANELNDGYLRQLDEIKNSLIIIQNQLSDLAFDQTDMDLFEKVIQTTYYELMSLEKEILINRDDVSLKLYHKVKDFIKHFTDQVLPDLIKTRITLLGKFQFIQESIRLVDETSSEDEDEDDEKVYMSSIPSSDVLLKELED